MEIWKDIDGFKGLYKVSNKGRVFSIKTNTILKSADLKGYRIVSLSKGNIQVTRRIHRLVAQAFLPVEINHKDGNKENNSVDNLEWVTHTENIAHAIKIGLHNPKGSGHGMHKLTEKLVKEIKEKYGNRELSCRIIGLRYGVSTSTISNIFNGYNWRHI